MLFLAAIVASFFAPYPVWLILWIIGVLMLAAWLMSVRWPL